MNNPNANENENQPSTSSIPKEPQQYHRKYQEDSKNNYLEYM
jgi:hypothetical protein